MADLVAGVAYIWSSDDKDSTWETVPLDAARRAASSSRPTGDNEWITRDPEAAPGTARDRARAGRRRVHGVRRDRRVRPGDAEGVHPQGHGQRRARAGASAARRSRTRACSSCSMPSSTTCPTPARTAASRWWTRTARSIGEQEVTRRRAGARARVQGHQRPVRHADVHPRLLRRHQEGRHAAQRHARQEGAHRAHRRGPGQPRKDIDEARAGDICAFVSMKETETGDSLCDPDHPALLERMRFPDPVISVSVEPKTRDDVDKMSDRALQDGEGRSVAASASRPGDRPDRAARHGRAAPRGHDRPHAHRARRRSQHGPAEGQLPRGVRHARRAHLHAQEADRRLGPVRRSEDDVRAAARRHRRRVLRRGRRRPHPARVHSRRSSTRSAPSASAARSPATRSSTSRRA